MNQLEKRISEKISDIYEGATPGFCLQVLSSGKKVCDLRIGKTWKYYDLASLTKIMFTVPWMIRAADQDRIDLQAQLKKYMSWYPHAASIQNTLNHSAGNSWWVPFYKMVDVDTAVELRKTVIREKIRSVNLPSKPGKAVYSDVDFFLLGFLLESIYQQKWLELWQCLAEASGVEGQVFFNEGNLLPKNQEEFAPTENCPWRKRILQGEVHDENAWSLSGVAPHAGLFATMEGVATWCKWWRQHLYGFKNPWARKEIFQYFAQRSIPASRGDWALGYMLPTPGSASCGNHFSPESVGHTGFTGTSIWFDIEKDIILILLSNRIHPRRENESFRKLRPKLHDIVMEEIGRI